MSNLREEKVWGTDREMAEKRKSLIKEVEMLRKFAFLLACLIIGLTLIGSDQVVRADEPPSSFIKVTGGAAGSEKDWETTKLTGTVDAEYIRLILGNLATGVKYQDYADAGEDQDQLSGHMYWYTRSPKWSSDKAIPYFFAAAGGTRGENSPDEDEGDFTWDFGMGILSPNLSWLYRANFLIEFGYKGRLGKSAIFGVAAGLQAGIDF